MEVQPEINVMYFCKNAISGFFFAMSAVHAPMLCGCDATFRLAFNWLARDWRCVTDSPDRGLNWILAFHGPVFDYYKYHKKMERGYLTWAFSFWNSLYVQHGNVWVSMNKSSREQTSPNRHFYENDRSQNKHLGYQYLIEKKATFPRNWLCPCDYSKQTNHAKYFTSRQKYCFILP